MDNYLLNQEEDQRDGHPNRGADLAELENPFINQVMELQPEIPPSYLQAVMKEEPDADDVKLENPSLYEINLSQPVLTSSYLSAVVKEELNLEIIKEELEEENCSKTTSYVLNTKGPRSKKKPIEHFECNYCKERYLCQSGLTLHLSLHKYDERPYVCGDCGQCFHTLGNLENHSVIHKGENPHVCDDCGECFKMRSELRKHSKIHESGKPFVCDDCGRCFKTRRSLKSHLLLHTSDGRYACNDCKKYFKHAAFHQSEKTHTCDVCGEMRRCFKYDLRTHTSVKPHMCDDCGNCFETSNILKSHSKIHKSGKQYVCNDCGRCLKTRRSIKSHLFHHKSEWSYVCNDCRKYFKRGVFYRNEKRHDCDICGKTRRCFEYHSRTHASKGGGTFSTQEGSNFWSEQLWEGAEFLTNLKEGACIEIGPPQGGVLEPRTPIHPPPMHASVKPHKCGDCGKCFKTSSILKSHSIVHKSELPFVCNKCGECFKRSLALIAHSRIHFFESYKYHPQTIPKKGFNRPRKGSSLCYDFIFGE